MRCSARVGVLFQALPAPTIVGATKRAKPGGYADSGADIAVALRTSGTPVVTPVVGPDPGQDRDWVFPDTAEGISAALAAGATTIWANTVLFEGHPLERFAADADVIAQLPAAVQRFDDKFETNRFLTDAGLPVASSVLVSSAGRDRLNPRICYPAVVKPVRGRGSQGVSFVRDREEMLRALADLFERGGFGDWAMVEEALTGEEFTVTVMPPAAPRPDGVVDDDWWALPPVRRFDHRAGVMPYNGDVAVAANSEAVDTGRLREDDLQAAMAACVAAARLVEARAPIRIDIRGGADGRQRLFDLNMKPNLTGAGRLGRDDQDSLCVISAKAAGWSYAEFLKAILATAWRR